MVLILNLRFQDIHKTSSELLWIAGKVVLRNINCLFYILFEYDLLMQTLKNKLNGIFGQVELKKKNDEMARHVMVEKRKLTLGIVTQTWNEIVSSLHMILAGNPGTGKTMIARYMTGKMISNYRWKRNLGKLEKKFSVFASRHIIWKIKKKICSISRFREFRWKQCKVDFKLTILNGLICGN